MGQVLARERDEVSLGDAGARAEQHKGVRRLAPPLVRQADDRDLLQAAAGGAPAVTTRTPAGTSPRTGAGALASEISTVGAAHSEPTFSFLISAKMVAGSTLRRQMWVPAAAVTVQVYVQPLAWNMGRVHRYRSPTAVGRWSSVPIVLIAAFRCVIITPFGRAVVPLV
jgi:hypothetical protein